MRASQKILNLLSKDGLAITGLDNLLSFVSSTYSIPKQEVSKDFNQLLNEGKIFEIRKGKFITIPSHGYVRASFIGNAKGYGFCEEELSEKEDIFIPANAVNGAIDGDKVIVKLLADSQEGREGQVVDIYKPVKYLAGVVTKVNNNIFVEPDNNHIPFKIKIISGGLKACLNDRVVVKVIRNKVSLSCIVTEVLGKCDDIKALEKAIIRDHGLFEVFPQEVIDEAKKVSQKITARQLKGRIDLRDKVIFTIDGLDAKDLDDAVSIERKGKNYILGVHIADVGEYVKYGSCLDQEAYNRGTSVYFPTSVLPMLPKALSNGICSLNEKESRLTLTVEMEVDRNGQVVSHKIYESVIKSVARLNYTDVQKVFDGEDTNEKHLALKEPLFTMLELSKIIQEKNQQNGNLDFEIPEVQFIFDEKGMAVDFEKRERNDAHRLIENFMVLANQTVAKEFCLREIPFVYRVHESPKKEKVLSIIDYLSGLGIKVPAIPEKITPQYYQELIRLASNQSYTETVNKVILRSMQKARYTNRCLGHFGLALEYYCHFTSPIRRYPDLTIHRIIKETLKRKKLSSQRTEELETFTLEAGEQSSLTEKNADKAEREVDDLWKAYLMKDRVGEEFEGTVSSVMNFGVFIELENTVEGFIRVEDLPDSGFLLFERQLKLKGQNMSIGVGDRVKVKLVSSNVFTRKIDFQFIGFVKK